MISLQASRQRHLCHQKLSFISQNHYSNDSMGSCVLLTPSFFHFVKGKYPGVIAHIFCPTSEIIYFSQKILFLIVEIIFGILDMLILMGCHWFSILFSLKERWLAFIFFIICRNYIKIVQGQSGLVFSHSEKLLMVPLKSIPVWISYITTLFISDLTCFYWLPKASFLYF